MQDATTRTRPASPGPSPKRLPNAVGLLFVTHHSGEINFFTVRTNDEADRVVNLRPERQREACNGNYHAQPRVGVARVAQGSWGRQNGRDCAPCLSNRRRVR